MFSSSTISSSNSKDYELQNRSDTNWNAHYDEAQQKFPPLNKLLDEEINTSPSPSQIPNKNNVTGSPPQNFKPLTTSAPNSRQAVRFLINSFRISMINR